MKPPIHQRVSKMLLNFICDYNIRFEDAVRLATDNASWMLAFGRSLLSFISPNCIHLSCVSHNLDLVEKEFCFCLSLLTKRHSFVLNTLQLLIVGNIGTSKF